MWGDKGGVKGGLWRCAGMGRLLWKQVQHLVF